jgi:hypothetical protein
MKNRNAYEIVDEIIASKVHSISERALDEYGAISTIVLEILKVDYNAHYVSSDEPRYCGWWYFDSPFWKKVDAYKLQYCYIDTDEEDEENDWNDLWVDTEKYPDCFIREIIRLDNNSTKGLYWRYNRNPKKYEMEWQKEVDRVRNELKTRRAYIGTDRIWRVVRTTTTKRIGK